MGIKGDCGLDSPKKSDEVLLRTFFHVQPIFYLCFFDK